MDHLYLMERNNRLVSFIFSPFKNKELIIYKLNKMKNVLN